MIYKCHSCDVPRKPSHRSSGDYIINCLECCTKFGFTKVETYFGKNDGDIWFAKNWEFDLDKNRIAVVESYSKLSAGAHDRDNSCIYLKNKNESEIDTKYLRVDGHPFTSENVKLRTIMYMWMI